MSDAELRELVQWNQRGAVLMAQERGLPGDAARAAAQTDPVIASLLRSVEIGDEILAERGREYLMPL
jgi:hypothetical protein